MNKILTLGIYGVIGLYISVFLWRNSTSGEFCQEKSSQDFKIRQENLPYRSELPIEINLTWSKISPVLGEAVTITIEVKSYDIFERCKVKFSSEGGVTLLDKKKIDIGRLESGQTLNFTVVIKPDSIGRGKFHCEISADLAGAPIKCSRTLFFLIHEERSYISSNSFLEAQIDSLKELRDAGKINDEEYNSGLKHIISGKPAPVSSPKPFRSPASIENTFIISGTIRWTDSQGNTHPARYVPVQIWEEENSLPLMILAECATNASGDYFSSVSVTEPDGADIYLQIYARSDGFDIVPPGLRNDPPSSMDMTLGVLSPTYSNVNQNLTIDYDIPNTIEQGNAFSVADALVMISLYAQDLTGSVMPLIPVEFPGDGAYFDPIDPNDIHISIPITRRYDWDTIQHEYGHYVAHQYGLDNSPGGPHYLIQNQHLGEPPNNKDAGIRLAWSEGWATFFAVSGQWESNASSMGVPNVGDAFYQTTEGSSFSYSLEEQTPWNSTGEDNELAVQRILWDLYDSAPDAGDNVSLNNDYIWNLLDGINDLENLSQAWNGFISGEDMAIQVSYGSIFTEHRVASELQSPQDNYQYASNAPIPTFVWEANGAGPSNLLNRFTVEFYNPAFTNCIFPSAEISSPSYQPSASDFQTILTGSNVIKWIVKGRNINNPETGIYISQARTFTIEIDNVDVALIIDRSGSMSSYGYLSPAKTAASTFVGFMQTGDNVAVISYSDYASVNYPLTTITSQSVIQSAQNAISGIYSGGWTSIGSGILAAQSQLNNGNSQFHQAMILLSDGESNRSPWVISAIQNLPENTDIYSVALGPSAGGDTLNYVADQTGGQYFSAAGPDALLNIYNLIRGNITGLQTIASVSNTITQGEIQSSTALLDALTSIVHFLLSFQGSDVDMELVTPSNVIINPGNLPPNVTYTEGTTYDFYVVDSPEAGEWTIRVIGTSVPGQEDYSASVQANSALTLDAHLEKSGYVVGQPILILAELWQWDQPISGGTVTAVIQTPDSILNLSQFQSEPYCGQFNPYLGIDSYNAIESSDSIILYDDGFHGDDQAGDGLYANYFTNTFTDGSYNFTIKAVGNTALCGQFSREASFSTYVNITTLPSTPTLLAPPNSAVVSPTELTLKWTIDSTSTYYLQVSSNQLFVPTLVDTANLTTDSLVISGLTINTTYFWRVNATGSSGSSAWSPVWSFCTAEYLALSPNPFVPERGHDYIHFFGQAVADDLIKEIKIYSKAGEMVRTLKSSEWINWDAKNDDGDDLASGVYLWLATGIDGGHNKGKFAIIK